MKHTIHLVIRNIGGELEIETFATAELAEAAAWKHVEELFDESGQDGSFADWRNSCDDDFNTAWVEVADAMHDTLHVEAVEIEVPDPSPTRKVTVYTLTTSDDGQMDTQFFDSEEALNAEILGQIETHCGDEFDTIWNQSNGDVHEVYSIAQNDHAFEIDMHWTSHEIDLPDDGSLAPHVTALVDQIKATSAWTDALEGEDDDLIAVVSAAGGALASYGKGPEPRSDVNAKLLTICKAMHAEMGVGKIIQSRAVFDALTEAIAEAETTLPMLKLKVVVEVSGGVAEITEQPDGVDVEIIDHDNLEDERILAEIKARD